jgi:hypothetical protein
MSYLAKPNGQPNFDASEMLMMHDMLRREFALMPGVVGRVAAGDHDRTQIVGDHIENVSTVLHHHHVLEDENVWPLLVDRCGASVAPSVDVIGAALVCPVGAREHVAGKVSLYGLGQLVQHLGM